MSSIKLRVDFDVSEGLAAEILGYYLEDDGLPPHTKPDAIEIIREGLKLHGYNTAFRTVPTPKWVNQAKLILTNMRII